MRSLLVSLVALAGVVACSTETIVVAEVSKEPAAGASFGSTPIRCTRSADCPDPMYCERRDCAAPAGVCVVPPTTCDNGEAPVCGCDGVTYFNDCLRRKNGASGAEEGECSSFVAICNGAAVGCPTNAYCARFVHYAPTPDCHDVVGRCWVIPDFCPPPSRGDRWNRCNDADAETCVSTCRAIQDESVFVEARSCN